LNQGDWVLSRFGFSIRLDPPPNGNCQFSAVANQLEMIGVHKSAETLCQEVVSDLKRNPVLPDRTPLDNFVGRNNFTGVFMLWILGNHQKLVHGTRISQMASPTSLDLYCLGE